MRAYIYVGLLLLAIFGSIAAYLSMQFAALAEMDFTPPPAVVAASYARMETWDQYQNAVGTIRAKRGVDLSSETSGEITDIHFESGDLVSAGALLLTLNNEVEKAARQSQIATLNLAKLLFERDSKLVEQKSISLTQFDTSKADLERAVAQLAETEARLRNKEIHAPFGGTVGIRLIERGDYLSPGTVITSLQDLSELEVDFTLPASAASRLKPGMQIELSVDAYPERVFRAELTALDAKVDPDTRNLLLRARIANGAGLLPGMFTQLRVTLGAPRQLVTVPETAVTYSLHGSTIYVINDDGAIKTVESQLVTTGSVREGRISILSGLEEGAHVVTAGQNKLYRGASINIDESVKL